jgi:uncharacterized protein YggU (UPF0235/DUF167 family)
MIIRVIPNARKFGIEILDGKIIARLKNIPAGNAANLELLSELKRITKARAFMQRGAKSRNKEIYFEGLSDEDALKIIAGVAEPGQKK